MKEELNWVGRMGCVPMKRNDRWLRAHAGQYVSENMDLMAIALSKGPRRSEMWSQSSPGLWCPNPPRLGHRFSGPPSSESKQVSWALRSRLSYTWSCRSRRAWQQQPRGWGRAQGHQIQNQPPPRAERSPMTGREVPPFLQTAVQGPKAGHRLGPMSVVEAGLGSPQRIRNTGKGLEGREPPPRGSEESLRQERSRSPSGRPQ